jgi:lysophospholipase L1-like esterase
MIKWIKKKDGTWEYDYTAFDQYVSLAMASGIKEQINCYSMVPVGNKFSWFDEETSETIIMEAIPGTDKYETLWRDFLNDFKVHLEEKGWLDITTLALDEREEEEMKNMFSFLRQTAPEFKITMSGFYYEAINSSIYDFSSNWRHAGKISGGVIESRKKSNLKTTYYVACGIPKPNNFTFSPPSESCYEGWFAAAKGFDGFLRWAYNSWPENPEIDSRYTKWPSGDTYLVYPDARSSVRFERLREGIQDYEKIRILRKELAENTSMEALAARERLNNFLNSIDNKTLDNQSAAEVINEGKQLIYQIVKSVVNNQSARSGNISSSHFWDEIPVSPSTTVPEKIKDDYWHGQYQRVNREVARADKSEIVFFGDSITWHWSLGGGTGKDVWKESYSRYNPINMGNSGDITPVMLYRVTHGNLNFAKNRQPKAAVLLCGTNNFVVTQSDGGKVQWDLGANCPPEDVAEGVRAIAQVFRRRLPHTRVIILGILPVSNKTKWVKCRQVNAVNAALNYNESEVIYLDLQDKFLQSDGSINKQLFTDGTHLTVDGYRIWAKSIAPYVAQIMKADPLDPVKIMFIGGSVTEGTNSCESYRRYLDGMLRREGNLIDFVGSRNKHNDNQTEPDSYQYDFDHEGHWGRNSDWLAKNMPGLIAWDVPDVAVIHMGTEDIVSGSGDAESLTNEIIYNISKVIKSLRLKNRTVKIVLAKIIPIQGKTDTVNLLNLKISRYIKAHTKVQSPVVVADLHTGFNASTDLADDGILPNVSGAKKMARIFADVINNMVSNTERR